MLAFLICLGLIECAEHDAASPFEVGKRKIRIQLMTRLALAISQLASG